METKELSELHRKRIGEGLTKYWESRKSKRGPGWKSIKDTRLELGLCIYCGKPNPRGTRLCVECTSMFLKKYGSTCRAYRVKIQKEVIDHYGGKCACCGESNPLFLTIDHINNDGKKHRREISNGKKNPGGQKIYYWLKENNFPEGFQVLCYNCNLGKARNNGTCPHISQY